MHSLIRKGLSVALCFCLVVSANGPNIYAAVAVPPAVVEPQSPIDPLLQKSYLELLELAPALEFSSQQFKQVRDRLKREEKSKKDATRQTLNAMQKQVQQAQRELKTLNASSPAETEQIREQRHLLHCRIQSLQSQLADLRVALDTGIPVEYDNYNAKLELLERWPATKREITQQIASGQSRTRRWGDVLDIGFRTIEPNQEDDIKAGQEAVQQMKQMGMMPKELEDPEITAYVQRIAQKVAGNSDLKVPLQVTVLNSKEINAFALPGGFLFINRGLLEETRNEAQLAGVIAHEISHDVARHGHRLMKRATMASILYQAAQVAAVIFTGGAAGIGAYYALQYGFYGLGLALSLQLLGVSRDFELEADLLGTQYAWKAGYNPEGFIQFFDIMASKEGYVEKTSFFRTHPAFYDRIVGVFREVSILGKKDQAIENTSEFQAIQARLKKVAEELDKEEKNRPSLFSNEPGCPEDAPAKK